MASRSRFWRRYPRTISIAVLLVVLVALFVAGAQPFAVNLIPSPWDKFAHVAVFTIVTAAVGISIGLQTAGVAFLAATIALAIGLFDEMHQVMLVGRNAGWDDLAADAIGALLGAIIIWRLRRPLGKHSPPV